MSIQHVGVPSVLAACQCPHSCMGEPGQPIGFWGAVHGLQSRVLLPLQLLLGADCSCIRGTDGMAGSKFVIPEEPAPCLIP